MGWGTSFSDFDNDGDVDLLVVNGHVYPQVDTWTSGTTYLQKKQLFENTGSKFREVTTQAGWPLSEKHSSRGAACFDYDNDGRLDIIINNLDGRPLLLHNESKSRGHYLMLRLLRVGAELTLHFGLSSLLGFRGRRVGLNGG